MQITNVYLPPSMNVDEWTNAFGSTPRIPPTDTRTIHILLGDWNVRLGEQTGDRRGNDRARTFTRLLQSRLLTLVPFASSTATFSDRHQRTSIPDFVLVTAGHLGACSPVTVIRENGGSDHHPIMLDVTAVDGNDRSDTMTAQNNPRRIAIHRLGSVQRKDSKGIPSKRSAPEA